MDTASVRYAGFWKRFVAAIIDGFVLAIVNFVIFVPALGMLGLGMAGTDRDMGLDRSPGLLLALVGTWMLSAFAVFAAGWLYFALMESSAKGGTLGKMALGIRVTDLNGNRISFARASGRYFGKIISAAILYIGFLMTAFTQQKQALHDIIAGCLVVIR
jgi:uncharacterized RDD family membrane protein YckC